MTSQDAAPQPVDPLTLATLYLCSVAYYADIATIQAAVAGTPTLAPGPHWKCLWGPAQNSDESNLAFVAGYFPAANPVPQYICVTIRGTDVDIDDIWGILMQIWEDIDATDPQPMPWAPGNAALVANGTLEGWAIVKALAPTGGPTLEAFLQGFLSDPANANVTTLVTGHSLGGCLATVVAPWITTLVPAYKGTIQPITFAAPTAGDLNFANYYDGLFPSARRFQSQLDIIPLGLYNLSGIDSIYASYGLDTPDLVWLAILGMEATMDVMDASYAQPSQGQQILPAAFFLNDQDDWYAQALHQHHLATYLGLLTGTPVDTTKLPQPSVAHSKKTRLLKRVGSIETALKRLTGI